MTVIKVISPHDKHIQAKIIENQVPWTWDVSEILEKVSLIPSNVADAYYAKLSMLSLQRWVHFGMRCL